MLKNINIQTVKNYDNVYSARLETLKGYDNLFKSIKFEHDVLFSTKEKPILCDSGNYIEVFSKTSTPVGNTQMHIGLRDKQYIGKVINVKQEDLHNIRPASTGEVVQYCAIKNSFEIECLYTGKLLCYNNAYSPNKDSNIIENRGQNRILIYDSELSSNDPVLNKVLYKREISLQEYFKQSDNSSEYVNFVFSNKNNFNKILDISNNVSTTQHISNNKENFDNYGKDFHDGVKFINYQQINDISMYFKESP